MSKKPPSIEQLRRAIDTLRGYGYFTPGQDGYAALEILHQHVAHIENRDDASIIAVASDQLEERGGDAVFVDQLRAWAAFLEGRIAGMGGKDGFQAVDLTTGGEVFVRAHGVEGRMRVASTSINVDPGDYFSFGRRGPASVSLSVELLSHGEIQKQSW